MVTNGNNGNPKKREQTAARIIEAIRESHGLLTVAAKRAGLGYMTVYRYVKEFPSVQQAVKDSKDELLDFAEAKLYEKIRNGDNTCLIFYLKCQGKDRGFVEKQEQSIDVTTGGEPLKSRDIPVSVIDEAMEILYRSGNSTPSPGDNRAP